MRSWLSAGAAVSVLAAASATAQGEEATPEVEETPSRETITVYGTSNPLPAFEYPGQVSVIAREEIELFAPSNISDVLRDSPGVEMSGGPRRNGETPSIRGFGRLNVLVLLDGARQSFTSGHDGAFFIDPELLRSAEIVRGPASALYGSGAVGGVLAFETVDASDLLAEDETMGARFRVGYQGANEEMFAGVSGFADYGAFDVLASFGWRDSGDIELGSGFTLPSDDDIVTGLLTGGYDFGRGYSVDASWQSFRNEAFEPDNPQGLSVDDGSATFNTVDKTTQSDTYRVRFIAAPSHLSWLDFTLTAYRTETSVEEAEPDTGRVTLREVDTTGLSARNAIDFNLLGGDHIFTLGGDWYQDEQSGRDSASADGARAGVPSAESTFYGAFAQLESTFERPFGAPGRLIVIPGVRFDRFENSADGIAGSDNEDEAVSPRIGATYLPVEWLAVFASWGEAFRAPNVNELYLDGIHFQIPHPILGPTGPTAPNFFIANPNLLPEESETFEVGFGLNFDQLVAADETLSLRASYFESEVENLIDLSVDFAFSPTCFAPPFQPCTSGTTNSANVAMAELEGYELEALFDSPRLRVSAALSHIDGRNVTTGAPLASLTPTRLNLDFRYRFLASNLSLGTRIQIADGHDNVATAAEERPGYSVVDIYGVWRPEFAPRLRVDAGIDNVFDTDYERVFAGVSEPGFNPRIALSYQIGG